MAEPLDYRNPQTNNQASKFDVPAGPVAVIPVEFDCLLTRTSDLAGAQAIEVELRRQNIGVFHRSRGGPAGNDAEIYVRSADRERAAPIASKIFARRRRIKSFPPIAKDNFIDPHNPTPDLSGWY